MRRARRNRIPKLALFLGLVAFGCFAWLSNFPTSPAVERLVHWPLIGPGVGWVRAFYLPPLPSGSSEGLQPEVADEGLVSVGNLIVEPAAEVIEASELLWLLPGSRLYRRPDSESAVLAAVAGVGRGRRVSRQGDWYEVIYRQHQGWTQLTGYDPEGDPPYGNEPLPPGPIEASPPDEQELAAALEVFGGDRREIPIGPYLMHTDVADSRLLRLLDGVAAQITDAYEKRYGRKPVGPAREQVVLYRSELSYRVVQQRWKRLRGLPSAGHHGRGVASLFVGDRSRADVAATLIHELVHALNTRAIGPALPPWLDEGLAEDLSYSALDEDELVMSPQELAGKRDVEIDRIRFEGPIAGLKRLLDEPSRPDPMAVMKLDWERFVRSDGRRLNYSTAGFWVRYLASADATTAARFRLFLDRIADGESVASERLIAILEQEASALRADFRAWLGILGRDSEIQGLSQE